ncbi:MAG: hypothetical protein GC168_18565 [Candidatus Hydrogenedens sp.]|nr:hypothetical protein [Candidatus Hydrogenedens sp.]
MSIGILAAAGSRQARRLYDRLEALAPGAAVRFDLGLEPEDRVILDGDAITWNGHRLDRFEAVHVHGFTYQDPVLPPADPICDWSLWQTGAVLQQQKYSFLFSLLSRLEAGRCRLYNPVSCHLDSFARFSLLDRLGQAGHRIPALLCTNDEAATTAFRDDHDSLVWRPLTGGAAWQVFQERQRRHLIDRDRPPILIAEAIPGPLIRVYALDGKPVCALGCHAPNREGLEQLETFLPVSPDDVPGFETIAPALAGLGCRWAMASCVVTPAGPVFYDVEPDAVLTDLPDRLAGHLIDALAASLLGRALPAPPQFEPAPRDALLLRRMLAIQFDMEASKYAP